MIAATINPCHFSRGWYHEKHPLSSSMKQRNVVLTCVLLWWWCGPSCLPGIFTQAYSVTGGGAVSTVPNRSPFLTTQLYYSCRANQADHRRMYNKRYSFNKISVENDDFAETPIRASSNVVVQSGNTRMHLLDDDSISHHRVNKKQIGNGKGNQHWSNVTDFRNDLVQFWVDCGVLPSSNVTAEMLSTIIIPNEAFLLYYQRHDLRDAIKDYGGREAVSQCFGGLPIMSERWEDAVATCTMLQRLVKRPENNLRADNDPQFPHVRHMIATNDGPDSYDSSFSEIPTRTTPILEQPANGRLNALYHLVSLRRLRKRQNLLKTSKRRHRGYWMNSDNFRKELIQFWVDCGVLPSGKRIGKDLSTLTIPNETLLRFYQRHDLRGAIAKHGGRDAVSEWLGGVPIMPGRWKDAFASSPMLQKLVRSPDNGLTGDQPPQIAYVSHKTPTNAVADTCFQGNVPLPQPKRCERQGKRHRRVNHYWTLQVTIDELYAFVDQLRITYNRPAVWMPRQQDMVAEGRRDLKAAVILNDGIDCMTHKAGMIPYRDWFYFEGQLQLFIELKRYLDQEYSGNYDIFPPAYQVRRRGYNELASLIYYYGGPRFLKARLNMRRTPKSGQRTRKRAIDKTDQHDELHWGDVLYGPFDLVFGIRLLAYIRNDHLKRKPPMARPMVAIPSSTQLLTTTTTNSLFPDEGMWLHEQILIHGGYENVARRLNLAMP